jgi:hypothetical protein
MFVSIKLKTTPGIHPAWWFCYEERKRFSLKKEAKTFMTAVAG